MSDSSLEPEIGQPAPATVGGTTAIRRPQRGGPNRLYSGGVIALVVVLGYYAYSSKTTSLFALVLGLLIFTGAALPSLLWAKRADFRFPVFEVFMLTGINTYAIPLLSGHEQLARYSEETVTNSALGIVLYQVVAILVYITTSARPKRTRAWTEEVVSHNITDYLAYGMAATTIYTALSGFTDWIPNDLNSVLRAACFGVGIVSTFIQARMWGQGTLPHYRKSIFIVQIALQLIFSWASLFLIGGISIVVLALLGYISGGKKIPFAALLVILPILGLLHNGKSVMREKYWENHAPAPTIAELPAFYSEWIENGLQSPENQTAKRETTRILDRTSLFHVLCLVVSESPSPRPYLNGETYGYVPSQFVPSFFWAGKPPAHVATNKLSVYYGLQATEDTVKTTIAFGLVTEAYANFGFFGIGLLAAVFAFCFKKFSDWSAESPMFSYPGLVLIVLMAWSFQAELTMAAWLGSLYQACFAILGIPFLMRNFLGE